jgi:hypothetical protein
MAEGVLVLPQLQVPEMTFLPTMDASERLSGSHACTSDTSSGPVPTLTADAVNSLTIVPVSNLDSVSCRPCIQQQQQCPWSGAWPCSGAADAPARCAGAAG